jgi:hypothetical protein
MLNLLLLVLSLLTACAANQSALPVPRPPFSPTLDAPITVGQPGHVGPMVLPPKSPHKRVLPETPETRKGPGIWAGDDAPGIRRHMFLVFDEPIPFALSADLDAVPAYDCAEVAQKAADNTPRLRAAIAALRQGPRLCLAIRALNTCMMLRIDTFTWVHKEALATPPLPVAVAFESESLKEAKSVLEALMVQVCEKNNPPAVDALLRDWVRAAYGDDSNKGRH